MSRRKSEPAAAVVEFFETAPPETAYTVLSIVTAIVARRMPPKAVSRKRTPRREPAPLLDAAKMNQG